MLMVWVNIDIYMAFKQILFSIVCFFDFVIIFFSVNLRDKKKHSFSSVFFNIHMLTAKYSNDNEVVGLRVG